MDGRQATVAALAVALIGIVSFLLLDGVVGGLVLFAAGVLLVIIGIFGWHEPAATTATVATADGGTYAVDPVAADLAADGDAAEVIADPADESATDPVLDVETWGAGTDADVDAPPAAPATPMMQLVGDAGDELAHVHDQPLLSHSDLVIHTRDYHSDLATDGSTIQLRLLHERAHGAPHELPVDLTRR